MPQDATTWAQYVSALVFVEYGIKQGSAWYCTAQPGGTFGTTAMNWSNFSTAANYTAGTGLTLTGYQFSITNTGVAAIYLWFSNCNPCICGKCSRSNYFCNQYHYYSCYWKCNWSWYKYAGFLADSYFCKFSCYSNR